MDEAPEPFREVVAEDAIIHVDGPIPVYLPDRTEVGTAVVDTSSGVATITLHGDSKIMELFKEDLVGLSVVYLDRNRAEEILTQEGEKTDAPGTQTLDS